MLQINEILEWNLESNADIEEFRESIKKYKNSNDRKKKCNHENDHSECKCKEF
jgi:hypothetical protein